MRPESLTTQIFLDSGDPAETKQVLETLGFLDGQTTNPSLVAKSPVVQAEIARGGLTSREAIDAYRDIVTEISAAIPNGSVSAEVYADTGSTEHDLVAQARQMYGWTPNLHVKLPCTAAGIAAARTLSREGMRLNMTLCFSQEQATAVHVATLGALPGQVYISPFIGRLDDQGQAGIDLIRNIVTWYRQHESHVMVLAASVRDVSALVASIQLGADIVTAPLAVLVSWSEQGYPRAIPGSAETLLSPISYKELPLLEDWKQYDITHPLTAAGIEKFVADWKKLLTPGQ